MNLLGYACDNSCWLNLLWRELLCMPSSPKAVPQNLWFSWRIHWALMIDNCEGLCLLCYFILVIHHKFPLLLFRTSHFNHLPGKNNTWDKTWHYTFALQLYFCCENGLCLVNLLVMKLNHFYGISGLDDAAVCSHWETVAEFVMIFLLFSAMPCMSPGWCAYTRPTNFSLFFFAL